MPAAIDGTHAAGLDQFFDQIFPGECLPQQRVACVLQNFAVNRAKCAGVGIFVAADGTSFHLIRFRALSSKRSTENFKQAK
jgi:hypothetical protein